MRRLPHTTRAIAAPRLLSLSLSLLAAALSAAASAPGAAAQTVVGTVTEQGTARPLPGVFVVLEDSAGGRAGGVLSGPDGRYILRAAAPGRYRFTAELIGYAGVTGGWVDLDAGASIRQDIEIAVQAVTLDGIRVETSERCRAGPGSGPETARLWAEARKALEVASWSERQGALRFQVVQHRRQLDARTLRVEAQEEWGRSGYSNRSPYRSIPAERLRAGGYIQQDADGEYAYYAPDAEVLLSDGFLETHCFSVAPGLREEPELVGLAFEPVPERDLPDVVGVLWLDRGSAELRRLDFTYRGVPLGDGDWPQVGGRVEFERLATGMWIVRRWRIRMPLAATRAGGLGGTRAEIDLLSLSEVGAEIRGVFGRDGTPIARSLGATLYGTATAAASGSVLAGATVGLAGTEHRTSTAGDGAYRLTDLPSGAYRVRLAHPDLDALGISAPVHDVELVAGRATRLRLSADLTAARARDLCAAAGWAAPRGNGAVVVFGAVRGPDGETPVPGALVRVLSGAPERRVQADSAGTFRICVPPSARALRLAAIGSRDALRGPSGLSIVEAVADAPGFLRVDLPLTPTQARVVTAGSRSRWAEAIVGRVLEEGTDRPVEGAVVALLDTAGGEPYQTVSSDRRGGFTLSHPGRGSRFALEVFALEVRHIGYETVRSTVPFPPGQEVRLDVNLATRAIPLEPIVVTERRRDFLAAQGFYDRRDRGLGIFVDLEEIESRRPSRLTDVLVAKPAIRLIQAGAFGYDIRVMGTERPTIRDGEGVFAPCQPSVFVDGSRVRGGGDPGPTDLALSEIIPAELVGGIEVYTHASRVPSQFGGSDAACGVVVIWTRNR